MKVRLVLAALACALGVAAFAAEPGPRTLTFEDRVNAQEAIERANYAHQIGASKSFEAAFPRHVLEEKVRTYLKQTVALENYWKTPVTATMLRRERERMERGTRMRERLRELYSALDDDTFLIEECLARATLADRLARNFLAFDERFQGAARREALEVRRLLSIGDLNPRAEHAGRVTRTIRRTSTPETTSLHDGPDLLLPPAEFDEWAEEVVAESASVDQITDDPDAYRIQIVIDRESDRLHIAEFRFPKRSWDEWWTVEKGRLDEARVKEVSERLPDDGAVVDLGDDCPVDDTWDASGSLGSVPEAYNYFTAVWTGSTMIVCGPKHSFWVGHGQTIGQYDPQTDSWETASIGGIVGRRWHTAVWTGTEMLVWGGEEPGGGGQGPTEPGGRYDPVTDTWTPISTVNAPALRFWHTAIWSGTEMIVWGGYPQPLGYANTGGRYDPSTDTWVPTSTGLNVPTPREGHTATWTGSEMIIWGGSDSGQPVNTGGRYDPSTDTWLPTSTAAGVPEARSYHSAIWTGSKMIVWGGGYGTSTGGRYDPSTDSWQPTSTAAGVPGPRSQPVSVWTGTEMLIWGGYGDQLLNTGGRYDPVGDTWSPMSTTNAPLGTDWEAAIWTGNRMLVWGGHRGGRYDPATDTWTPVAGTPAPRAGHLSVWTGTEMIVWGGEFGENTGGRYNLVTESWTPTATTGAPSAGQTAIWTGTEMIVWGGSTTYPSVNVNTGGRYNPSSDTWAPTSTGSNVPSPRNSHAAVWTGSEMIIWGGSDSAFNTLNTGGKYNPSSDTWVPTSIGSNVPSPRAGAAAAWTGTKMLIWGGPHYLSDGARYDPSSDSWTTMSTEGAPEMSDNQIAVWTGSALFATSGFSESIGGLYHPSTDSWTPTAPLPRSRGQGGQSSAIWAGSRVILWGGVYNNTGDRYDPVSDSWQSTRVDTAPTDRESHSAVWTGKWMIIWGGWHSGPSWLGSGSRYAVNPDDDADGVTSCAGDCNDHSYAVHPGAAEQCNGVDDNCNSAIDDDPAGVDSDTDGIRNACDNCRFALNPDQLDADGDFIGSACDNCITVVNPGQQDLDLDQRGDACDNCVSAYNPFQDDFDVDRRGDACDNCVFDFNPTQSNFDHDGQGDRCDLNDGLIYVFSTDPNYIEWQVETGPGSWNVYEGDLGILKSSGTYAQTPGSNPLAHRACGVSQDYAEDFETPPTGAVKFSLVTGVTGGIEGGLGTNSTGAPRVNANPCP